MHTGLFPKNTLHSLFLCFCPETAAPLSTWPCRARGRVSSAMLEPPSRLGHEVPLGQRHRRNNSLSIRVPTPPASKLAGILTGNSMKLLQQKHAHKHQRKALPLAKREHKEPSTRKTPSKCPHPQCSACPAALCQPEHKPPLERNHQREFEGKVQQGNYPFQEGGILRRQNKSSPFCIHLQSL